MPDVALLQRATILSFGLFSLAKTQIATVAASATWGSTRALFLPFRLTMPHTIKQIAYLKGATVAGNVDAGIYTIEGTRIVSTGSVAMAATANIVQALDIADTRLGPGTYMMALSLDTSTATVFVQPLGATNLAQNGLRFTFGTFLLPATAAPARVAGGNPPVMALITQAVV